MHAQSSSSIHSDNNLNQCWVYRWESPDTPQYNIITILHPRCDITATFYLNILWYAEYCANIYRDLLLFFSRTNYVLKIKLCQYLFDLIRDQFYFFATKWDCQAHFQFFRNVTKIQSADSWCMYICCDICMHVCGRACACCFRIFWFGCLSPNVFSGWWWMRWALLFVAFMDIIIFMYLVSICGVCINTCMAIFNRYPCIDKISPCKIQCSIFFPTPITAEPFWHDILDIHSCY